MYKKKYVKNRLKFSIPSAFLIALFFGLIVVIASWVVPSTSTYKIKHLGIIDIFLMPILGFQRDSIIIIFLIFFTGFLHIVIATQVLSNGIKKIANKFSDNLWILITILIVIFAICGSIFSMWEESLPFYPIIAPIFLELGFNEFAPIFIILLGVATGVLSPTLNPFAIGISESAVNTNGTIVSNINGLIPRFIIFIIFLILAILIGNFYCFQNKKNNTKLKIKSELLQKEILNNNKINGAKVIKNNNLQRKSDNNNLNTKKLVVQEKANRSKEPHHKHTFIIKKNTWSENLILTITLIIFLILITSLIPWDNLFNTHFFADVKSWISQNLFYFMGNLFWKPFGNWTFLELSGLFLIGGIIVAIIARLNEKKFFTMFLKDGSSFIILVIFIIAFFSGISVLMKESNLLAILSTDLEAVLRKIPLVYIFLLLFIIFCLLSFIIPSLVSLALGILPIFGPLIFNLTHNSNYVALVIIVFVLSSGLINMISPSVAVLHGICEIQNITFKCYVKSIYKIVLFYGVVIIGFIIALSFLI